MADGQCVSRELDVRRVRSDGCVELDGHARGNVSPLRREAQHDDAIAAGFGAGGERRRHDLAIKLRKLLVLHHEHDVRTVLPELLGHRSDAGWAYDQRVYFAARRVRESARRGRGLERNLPKRVAARFCEYENVHIKGLSLPYAEAE